MNGPFSSILPGAPSSNSALPPIGENAQQQSPTDEDYRRLANALLGKENRPCTSPAGVIAGSFKRKPLIGGIYQPDDLLSLLNSYLFVAKTNGAYPIAQVEEDGSIRYISRQDFATKLANMFVMTVDGHGNRRKMKAELFWLSHSNRDEREVIFDPTAPSGRSIAGKYNLWRGFGVKPRRPTGKQRRFSVTCGK
jgi:hypothetical protein